MEKLFARVSLVDLNPGKRATRPLYPPLHQIIYNMSSLEHGPGISQTIYSTGTLILTPKNMQVSGLTEDDDMFIIFCADYLN